ncbi:MAG: fimbrillin family protein [Bacteroidales bacterium]|nr:fimbrillin family protein [Bacteroidales bacterium]
MKRINCLIPAALSLICGMASCSWDATEEKKAPESMPLLLESQVTPPTRSGVAGFAEGDRIGLYVVNYTAPDTPGMLHDSGNHADNVPYVYNAQQGLWQAGNAEGVYWKDLSTKADLYAYYPYGTPDGVTAYTFTVAAGQHLAATAEAPGGYEQSDLLWGRTTGVAPQPEPVNITFRHLLSKVTLSIDRTLLGENLQGSPMTVTFPDCMSSVAVNLADGSLTAADNPVRLDIRAMEENGDYSAILVPQTVTSDAPLFEIRLGGRKYTYNGDLTLESGKQYHFNIAMQPHALVVIVNQIVEWESTTNIYVDNLEVSDDDGSGDDTGYDIHSESEGVRADRAALIAFYNRTDGANWKNSQNWCTDTPLSTWKGVSVTDEGRVRILNLSNNTITGEIPGCVGQLTELTSLQLYNNQFTGSIPDSIFLLGKLTTLGLYKNQLTGTLSENVQQLSKLTSLNVSQNQLSGPIPAAVGNLSKLNTLNLSQNNFTGNLPESIASLASLKTLNVAANRLSGTIPEAVTAHGNWSIWNPETNILAQQEGYGLLMP